MGNLNETEKWEENIYQLETSDPVLGGADGISNRAPPGNWQTGRNG
ncbi:hypothetical protein [Escherichia coli]